MKIQYSGKISYTIDKHHPDIKCIEGWTEDKIYTFEDIYSIDMGYTEEEMMSYIKHDLMLVAGGGYNKSHIHNVNFVIKRA